MSHEIVSRELRKALDDPKVRHRIVDAVLARAKEESSPGKLRDRRSAIVAMGRQNARHLSRYHNVGIGDLLAVNIAQLIDELCDELEGR